MFVRSGPDPIEIRKTKSAVRRRISRQKFIGISWRKINVKTSQCEKFLKILFGGFWRDTKALSWNFKKSTSTKYNVKLVGRVENYLLVPSPHRFVSPPEFFARTEVRKATER